MSESTDADINEYERESESAFEKLREDRQREVDRLSLELLSNTKHYKKYIAKNHPEERLKRADDTRRFLKYKSKIAALFIELLDEYEEVDETDNCVGPELHSIFREFVQKTIQHLEWTEYSNTSEKTNDFDDDMMFATPQFKQRTRTPKNSEYPYSYWGATIRKQDNTAIDDV
jgi:hypothetical protein